MIFPIGVKILFFSFFIQIGRSDDDRFWILFDRTNVFECQGVNNKMTINKEDVSIVDKNGKLALYLECPNEYTIVIKNVKAKEQLPNLSGDIGAKLQVPLVQGPGGLSLDYPYQVIPQKKAFEGTLCDNESGVITDNGKEFCRYCELCESVSHGEQKVGPDTKFGHKYINVDPNDSMGKKCKQLDANSYTLRKTVNVPGKKEIQDSVNQNAKGKLDENLEKKLKIGKGKFNVYIQMFSSTTPPASANTWYPNHKGCECCVKDAKGDSNCQKSFWNKVAGSLAGGAFAGSGNNCPKCNNDYVKTCLTGTSTKVSCYTIEFNFRVTDKQSDVDQFKAQNDIDNKQKASNFAVVDTKQAGPETKGVIAGGTNGTGTVVLGSGSVASQPAGGGGPAPCNTCSKTECINKISFKPSQTYCNNGWQDLNKRKFCCPKCPTVCSQ